MLGSALWLPWLLAAAVALIVLLPLLRMRWRTGLWAVVVRGSSGPVERFVRAWMVALLLAIAGWTASIAAVDASALGVWRLPQGVAWLGVGAGAVSLALVSLAQAQMGRSWRIGIDDRPTELVTRGIYRRVRHPIYTGILLLLGALFCLTPSAFALCAGLLGYLLIGVQCRLEDEHMLLQHGDAYRRWARGAGRFVPGLGRWHGQEPRGT